MSAVGNSNVALSIVFVNFLTIYTKVGKRVSFKLSHVKLAANNSLTTFLASL